MLKNIWKEVDKMKKYIKLLIILLLVGITLPVKAANYAFKELIPQDKTTTIRGNTFLYKNLTYQNGVVKFELIKNNSKEKKPLSVSIGLFDEKGKNIGIINYCSAEQALNSKEEKENFIIDINGASMESGKTYKDIKYISILGENSTCRLGGSQEFIGQTVEEIGMARNNQLTSSELLIVNIFKVILVALVLLFIYKFLFTGAYRNMDGEDVRQEYAYINKELRKEREQELKRNPPKPKEPKKVKSDEIIEQERIQNEKDKADDSDLHHMYK